MAAPKISEENSMYGYEDAFIFVEGGVEFAVYPDGQFDFFYNSRRTGYNVNVVTPHVNISFNAGRNYDPFVQYDDFGAVIQIEHVPVFYDYYGRIIQAGNVYISYNRFGSVARIGGLVVHYDVYRNITHYSGYINAHNPRYIYRPWHNYYTRPHSHHVVVHHRPYRAHYYPNRVAYGYYVDHYSEFYSDGYRRSYYRPGERVASYHRGRRTSEVRDLRPRKFDSDYSVATRMDARDHSRSNSDSRRIANTVETKKSRSYSNEVSQNRGRRNSVTAEERETARDTRSSQRQDPFSSNQRQVQQRNNTRETSRDTGSYSRGRESRTNTPAVQSRSRSTTAKSPARTSTSRSTGNTSSRSSRGRGN